MPGGMSDAFTNPDQAVEPTRLIFGQAAQPFEITKDLSAAQRDACAWHLTFGGDSLIVDS